MAAQSVTVEQFHNPRFNSELPRDDDTNPEHVYSVVRAVNILSVKMKESLTPARVQDLIDMGVNVTIQPVK